MKVLQHPLFIACLLLFCLNQVLENNGVYVWPLHTHLDDFLCLPLTLTIILAAERVYFQNPAFILPKRYLVIAAVLFSLMFEVILPLFAARYTADPWDVIAYAAGALLFQLSINRHAPTKTTNQVNN
ncbi:hypothetical protein [Pontibacter sp. H249]|uniref:hypothetical protein n=1 Tax=Pontibacter sp. H249 TaxID=3133420 RepID=UPI0030C463EE